MYITPVFVISIFYIYLQIILETTLIIKYIYIRGKTYEISILFIISHIEPAISHVRLELFNQNIVYFVLQGGCGEIFSELQDVSF